MKALVFKDTRTLALEDRPKPSIDRRDDVVVNIALTGVCGTDRGIYAGKFPADKDVILGHEAVGVVHTVGPDVQSVKPGDRVVIDPTLHCGWCTNCREGRFNFCANKKGQEVGVDRNGSFAEQIVLPEKFIYPLPESMPFDRAVFIEPLACVLNNLEAANIGVTDTVLVLGAGPIGWIAALVADQLAARVMIVEKHAGRLRRARRTFEHVIDGALPDIRSAVLECNAGRRPKLIVDTTGVLLDKAIEWVDDGGRIVLMGFNQHYEPHIRPLYLTNHGIRLIGAGDYNQNLPDAMIMIENLALEEMISHRCRLSDFQQAFDLLESDHGTGEEVMKVVFEFGEAGR